MTPRILKARDIERLENTSFANVSLPAADASVASVHVAQDTLLTPLTQFLNLSQNLDAGCDGSESCTGGDSCTGGKSCTGVSCGCFSGGSDAATCCPATSVGSCTCQANEANANGDNVPGPIEALTVAVAKPFGWQL